MSTATGPEGSESGSSSQSLPSHSARRTITFAAGLQPLTVPRNEDNSINLSSLLAATPHVPVNRKLFTDRCKSKLASSTVPLRPATSRPAARLHSQPLPQQPERRCSTAPAPFRVRPFGQPLTDILPEVLHFETWWQQNGQQQRMTIDFHTSTKEFHIRGPQELWLSMVGGSGQQLEHWDLHIGAELDVLGRRVVLRKASCATVNWLDAWTHLLLRHKERLELQLSKFASVLRAEGLLRHDGRPCMVGDQGLQASPTELVTTGGRVNLRHLREDVAYLAWRLRQHTASVFLPPELQDLRPQGPSVWSIPGVPGMSPQVCNPFSAAASCKTPHYATSHQLLQRSFKSLGTHKTELPSVGQTPCSLHALTNQLAAFNRVNLWEYIQSNPLAASAAIDRHSYSAASDTQPSARLQVRVQAGGVGMGGAKTPGPISSSRAKASRTGKASMSSN